MQRLRDYYTQYVDNALSYGGNVIGTTHFEVEVHSYTDVRNLNSVRSFEVTVVQRVRLNNCPGYGPSPQPAYEFNGWIGQFTTGLSCGAPSGARLSLTGYEPRTLNTSVNSSISASASSTDGTSQQYTSGSSTSQTNTFGFSLSGGLMGDVPTGSAGLDFQHSRTNETSESRTTGSSAERSRGSEDSFAMSIKDWGSFASVGSDDSKLSWVWGQQYPWNVLQVRVAVEGGPDDPPNIPQYVCDRLTDGRQLFPPSELSMFGIDVVCRATWLIVLDKESASGDNMSIANDMSAMLGSYMLRPRQPNPDPMNLTLYASLEQGDLTSTTVEVVDLQRLSIDPLVSGDEAVIGFVRSKFDVPIDEGTPGGTPFAIRSDGNDLLVRGSGFTGTLSTDFSSQSPVTLDICFKVVDPKSDLSLSLKNWVVGSVPCRLDVTVNGCALPPRFVDLPEEGSGPDTVTRIPLRYRNFASVNYCDLISVGLNTVSITVSATDKGAEYRLLALAVG